MHTQLSASASHIASITRPGFEHVATGKQQRIPFIDVARGITILLVVFGHNWIVSSGETELSRVMMSFRMPLFFFVAGMFLPENKSIVRLLAEKADALLKPFFATALLFAFYLSISSGFHVHLTRFYFGVMYATPTTLFWRHLWFLPLLFLVVISGRMLCQYVDVRQRRPAFVCGVVSIVLVLGLVVLPQFGNLQIPEACFGKVIKLDGLPWNIDLLGIALFFYLVGYLLRDHIKQFSANLKSLAAPALIFLALHVFFNYTLGLADRRYDHEVVSTLEALTGIYVVLWIAKHVSAYKGLANALTYIGSRSLFVLIWHWPIQNALIAFLQVRYPQHSFFDAIISYVPAVVLPLILWELVARSRVLSFFFLPLKATPHFRYLFVENRRKTSTKALVFE